MKSDLIIFEWNKKRIILDSFRVHFPANEDLQIPTVKLKHFLLELLEQVLQDVQNISLTQKHKSLQNLLGTLQVYQVRKQCEKW